MRNRFFKNSLTFRPNSGFTLLELMISLSLGTIILAGLYYLFAQNKNIVRTQTLVYEAQAKANFAMEVIAEDIQMAGWGGVNTTVLPFSPDPNAGFADFGTRFDVLVINKVIKDGGTDCTGVPVTAGVAVLHEYNVMDTDGNGTFELVCITLGGQAVIVDNVEAFQVLYGIDDDPSSCGAYDPAVNVQDQSADCMAPTKYVDGNTLWAELNNATTAYDAAGDRGTSHLDVIKTIRVGIMVATKGNEAGDDISVDATADRLVDPAVSKLQTYTVLDREIGHGSPFADVDLSDGRIRRVAVRTVALRQANRGP